MRDRDPDIEITATVRADEMRFDCKPKVDISAHADSPASAESFSARTNLPDEVEPGVTYRDVAVHWRLSARLDDLEPLD